MHRILTLGILLLLVLTACAGPAAQQQVTEAQARPDITIFRSPT